MGNGVTSSAPLLLPVPMWLDTSGSPLAAWRYQPVAPARSRKVLIVPSIAYEDRVAESGCVALAQQLAAAGFEVLTFDHYATDQSPGSLTDEGIVNRWIRDIASALDSLGTNDVDIVTFRLGALLTLQATRGRTVRSIVLLSPTTSGKRFVRELRAMQAAGGTRDTSSNHVVAGGYAFPEDVLRDLAQLDVSHDATARMARTLVYDSPARPVSASVLGLLGAATKRSTADDIDRWIDVSADQSEMPHHTIRCVVADLTDAAGADVAIAAGAFRAAEPDAPSSPGWHDGSRTLSQNNRLIVEDRRRIGAVGLAAVFTRPRGHHQTDSAVLFLSTTGPGDSFGHAAKEYAVAGIASLRVDFAGFRESGLWPGQPPGPSFYQPYGQRDLEIAVKHLRELGYQSVVVVGICSAAWAMVTAGPIDGIRSLVAVNPQFYVSSNGAIPWFLKKNSGTRSRHERSLRTAGWAAAIVRAHISHYSLRRIRQLILAGVSVHLVFADDDTGLTFWRLALKRRSARLRRRGLHVDIYPGLGHNLDNPVARADLLTFIRREATRPEQPMARR